MHPKKLVGGERRDMRRKISELQESPIKEAEDFTSNITLMVGNDSRIKYWSHN